MNVLSQTLDIREERDDLQQTVDRLEREVDELVDEALEIDPPEDEEDEKRLQEIEQQVDELETKLVGKRGYLNALDRAVDQWDGSEIVIRELTGAESRTIKDQARQKADELGIDYTDNIHETMFLQKAVVSTPPDVPGPGEIGDLPKRQFDWVLNRANALNSVGAFEMGNSSLRERMREKETETEKSSSQTGSKPSASNTA